MVKLYIFIYYNYSKRSILYFRKRTMTMDKKFSDYNDDEVIIVLDDELIAEDSICKDIQGSIYIAITPDTNRGFEKILILKFHGNL